MLSKNPGNVFCENHGIADKRIVDESDAKD